MEASADLTDSFFKHFEIVSADTPELLRQAFELRFHVYCEEKQVPGFNVEDYSNRQETDHYDRHSVHALLRHRQSGSIAGNVRLVLPDPQNRHLGLPLEDYVGALSGLIPRKIRKHAIGEISRFMLSQAFRSRQGEWLSPDGLGESASHTISVPRDRRIAPHPVLGLMKAAVTMTWKHRIRFFFGALEPRLHRRLSQFGINLTQVTDPINYHGPVCVYFGDMREIMLRCQHQQPAIWRFFTDNGDIWSLGCVDGLTRSFRRPRNQQFSFAFRSQGNLGC